jgi:hypothetical protein
MSEDNLLEEHRQELRDWLRWFSNAKKQDREIWVCRQFLQNLGLAFDSAELLPVEDQAPDVLFREVRFEVKELLDPDRRRTDEYKEDLRRAEEASSIEELDLWECFTPVDLTPEMIVSDIEDRIAGWAALYEPRFRSTLDLLVYYNIMDLLFEEFTDTPQADFLGGHGFRSISMTTGSHAWVLWAGPSSPDLISSLVGLIRPQSHFRGKGA